MRFNLLLYVPTVSTDLDVEYGVFVQHHLMDDADIGLDYFEFRKINPENYALDIVDEKEVTKKLRKDCLVDGFKLNSYYSIDLNNSYNRNISKDEVRQVFICIKSNLKEPIDTFIRVNDDQNTKDYHVHNNLIFFTLWRSPDMKDASDFPLNVGKVNYSDFEYFKETVKQEVNNQWHSVLDKKRQISKPTLLESTKEEVLRSEVNEESITPELQTIVSVNIDDPVEVSQNMIEETPQFLVLQDNTITVEGKKESETFRIIASILLALGIISIVGKLLGLAG